MVAAGLGENVAGRVDTGCPRQAWSLVGDTHSRKVVTKHLTQGASDAADKVQEALRKDGMGRPQGTLA